MWSERYPTDRAPSEPEASHELSEPEASHELSEPEASHE